MLHAQDLSGRKNWVTDVRLLLCRHGFGYIWAMQNPGHIPLFIKEFKIRLKDINYQLWHDSVSSDEDYCLYHPEIIRANYIVHLDTIAHRRVICLLRCGKLNLNGIPRFGQLRADPYCKQCDGNQVENLVHFFLICPKYHRFRKKYLPGYYYRFPSSLKIQLLCQNLKGNLAMKTALYIINCMNIRS